MTMKVVFTYISPEIEVTAPVLVASTSYKEPVALTGYAQPVAVTGYVQAMAAADWDHPVVAVSVDMSGMNKMRFDEFTAEDLALITFTKGLADAGIATDSLLPFSFTKALADTVPTSEDLLFSLVRNMADTAGTGETFKVSFTKPLADVLAAPGDERTNTFTKARADSVTVTDSLSGESSGLLLRTLTKERADTVSLADSRSNWFEKTRADAVSLSDADTYSFTKAVADTATATTSIPVASITKPLADSVTPVDDMDGVATGDQVDYTFTKVMSDATGTTDSDAWEFTKALADTAGTSDSGYMLFIDYADGSYFAQDYVGVTYSLS